MCDEFSSDAGLDTYEVDEPVEDFSMDLDTSIDDTEQWSEMDSGFGFEEDELDVSSVMDAAAEELEIDTDIEEGPVVDLLEDEEIASEIEPVEEELEVDPIASETEEMQDVIEVEEFDDTEGPVVDLLEDEEIASEIEPVEEEIEVDPIASETEEMQDVIETEESDDTEDPIIELLENEEATSFMEQLEEQEKTDDITSETEAPEDVNMSDEIRDTADEADLPQGGAVAVPVEPASVGTEDLGAQSEIEDTFVKTDEETTDHGAVPKIEAEQMAAMTAATEQESAVGDPSSGTDPVQDVIERVGEANISIDEKKSLLEEMRAALAGESCEDLVEETGGAPVKVLKMAGGSTGISHYDPEQELYDLQEGITNADAMYASIATDVMQGGMRIADDPDVSTAEKIQQLQQTKEQLQMIKDQRDLELGDALQQQEKAAKRAGLFDVVPDDELAQLDANTAPSARETIQELDPTYSEEEIKELWDNDPGYVSEQVLYTNDGKSITGEMLDENGNLKEAFREYGENYRQTGLHKVSWMEGSGAVEGTENPVTLEVGTRLDRWNAPGAPGGNYLAEADARFEDLQLPVSEDKREKISYVVEKPLDGVEGIIEKQPFGGGADIQPTKQFITENTDELEKAGYLKRIDVAANDVPQGEVDAAEDGIDWSRTSLTPEEEALVHEMEEAGAFDVLPSQMSSSSVDMSVPRLTQEPIVIDMPCGKKQDYEAFLDQGRMQEDGMNDLSVAEYLENYKNRKEYGRAQEGTKTQKEYRYIATEVTAADLMEENPGMGYEEARAIAVDMYKKGAALHNPDQIAGGDPTEIHAIGNRGVNSAFGSLWGHDRAEELYNKIVELSKDMTEEQRRNTKLHVKFNMHPK